MVRMPLNEELRDPLSFMGLDFKNRVGVAAGFDKNGTKIIGLALRGFGHIEVGTVRGMMHGGLVWKW